MQTSAQNLTSRLANPTRFMSLSATALPWVGGIAAAFIAFGLYLAFFSAPPDYQQGQTVKIMFIHVPSAWLAMGIYLLVAISSFGLLVFRHPLADVSAKAAVPLGAAFTFLALVGIVLLPIIKFSVEWWNTLHQPASVLRFGGPSIHASILVPLLVMAVGFVLAFTAMHLMAMRNEILRRRVKALTLAEVSRAGAGIPAGAKG